MKLYDFVMTARIMSSTYGARFVAKLSQFRPVAGRQASLAIAVPPGLRQYAKKSTVRAGLE
jgi:hypothetical protein